MKVKLYKFSNEVFTKFFGSTGVKVFDLVEGFPEDATILSAQMDIRKLYINLLVESKSFAEIADNELIPEGQIILRDVRVL